jgi:diaminopimelate decarboxylase
VFTGVGKTDEELSDAVHVGVAAVNVESVGEVKRLSVVAAREGRRARLALRVNPDVDALSHPHISTGLKTNKFGIPLAEALDLYLAAAADPHLEPTGVHVHIGSQIVSLDPIQRAVSLLVALSERIRATGVAIEHLDVGGGLGISYDGQPVLEPAEYVRAVIEIVRPTGLKLVLEPGRAIVGPAGALVTRVIDVKPQADGKWFVVTDAGMTELVRPALYGAYHRIQPAELRASREHVCDVVGPVCETSDTLGTDRHMPLPEVGDVLAVLDAGAYGAVMASNYNRRVLPPEILVDAGRARVVRRRQTIDDMLALEQETAWDG